MPSKDDCLFQGAQGGGGACEREEAEHRRRAHFKEQIDDYPQEEGETGKSKGRGGGSLHDKHSRRAVRRQKRKHLRDLERQTQELIRSVPPRKVANPGPIGLLGFGMTTILLNLHNTGFFPLFSVIPCMGICYGGGAQLIAGLLEYTKGNTFACIAFTSFGAFWLSLVCVWMLPNATLHGQAAVQPTTSYMLGVYLLVWGLFSFAMMICTFRMNVAICVVFVTVTLLFLLLAGGNMTGNATALKVAGYEGIICGSSALYLAFAEILNEVWDRTILPIIPMTHLWACCDKNRDHDPQDDLPPRMYASEGRSFSAPDMDDSLSAEDVAEKKKA